MEKSELEALFAEASGKGHPPRGEEEIHRSSALTRITDVLVEDEQTLQEYFQRLLSLHSDPAPNVRVALIHSLEAISRIYPQYASFMWDLLNRCIMEDHSPAVAGQGLLTACNMLYTSLHNIITDPREPQQRSWRSVVTFTRSVEGLIDSIFTVPPMREYSAARVLYATKYKELMVIAMSSINDQNPTHVLDIDVGRSHSIVDVQSIRLIADSMIGSMCRQFHPNMRTADVICLINSLVRISRNRNQYLCYTLPAISSISKLINVDNLKSPHVTPSIQHSIRNGVWSLLEIKHEDMLKWSETLVASVDVKSREHAIKLQHRLRNTSSEILVKRPADRSTSDMEPPSKRPREEGHFTPATAQPINHPPQFNLQSEELISVSMQIVEVLISSGMNDLISDLIVESMKNEVMDSQVFLQRYSNNIVIQQQMGQWVQQLHFLCSLFQNMPQGHNVASQAAIQAAIQSASVVPGVVHPTPVVVNPFQPPQIPEIVPSTTIPPTANAPPIVKAEQRKDPRLPDLETKEETPSDLPKETRDRVKEKKKTSAPAVKVEFSPRKSSLSSEESKSLVQLTLRELYDAEHYAITSGKLDVRNKMLGHLASTFELNDGACEEMLQYIARDFVKRKDIASSWLHREALRSEAKRYEKVYDRMFRSCTTFSDVSKRGTLSWLLIEVPYIQSGSFDAMRNILEESPSQPTEKNERITTVFGALRDIVLHRPADRTEALDLLLSFAHHADEELRTLCVRVTTNALFKEKEDSNSRDILHHAEKLITDLIDDDAKSESLSSRHLSLFMALCTKKNELLFRVAEMYGRMDETTKKLTRDYATPILSSLDVHSDMAAQLLLHMPEGSEQLILYYLNILTRDKVITNAIVRAVHTIYPSRVPQTRFLLPILSAIDKEEILRELANILTLPAVVVKSAIQRILFDNKSINASELFGALHTLDVYHPNTLQPVDPQTMIKKVAEAIEFCLAEDELVTQEVIAGVLQQLLSSRLSNIPALFMRTVLKSLDKHKNMIGFTVTTILPQLISKQVWTDRTLWEGFVKCCRQTSPHCFPVIISLPPEHMEDLIAASSDMRDPLKAWATRHGHRVPF
ncbi:symplekin [Planoprotostelium fungivorum]|uniref:Symplekin n=1 Tax=Planoprotostelium fungivorum TaxID=1890364 RepID=A0A2P6MVA5_9EUKA|nr:symplekin [Planoprotostelium fungivorum]